MNKIVNLFLGTTLTEAKALLAGKLPTTLSLTTDLDTADNTGNTIVVFELA